MRPKSMIVVGCLLAGSAGPAQAAGASSYLFDVLNRPEYRASWNRMLSGAGGIPRWLAQYARTQDGPATPGVVHDVGGAEREFYHVCEAHNCGSSAFEVMFGDDGADAKGILLIEGRPTRFYGNPTRQEIQAMSAAADE